MQVDTDKLNAFLGQFVTDLGAAVRATWSTRLALRGL
jgi:hypothetical protein